MQIHRPAEFFRRVGAGKLIGFGESYMVGDWDAHDLGGFLTELSRHIAILVPEPLQKLRALVVARHPDAERGVEENTRDNIARHYDLSNDMFATFLDETMTYSSALFVDPPRTARSTTSRATVASAPAPGMPDACRPRAGPAPQARPAARPGRRRRGHPGARDRHRLGRAVHPRRPARRHRPLGDASPASRRRWPRTGSPRPGLSDRVTIDLLDYRAVDGEYDAVVSVEMIEAVGHEFWPTYFEKIDSLLAPGGKAAIQAITMPHDRMLATRYTYTWVHKYIFPGGFLPSVEAIDEITRQRTTMRISDRLSMGLHYAETLRLWDQRFLARQEEVHALGFDSVFDRMWHFYLEYCRAGFASQYIDVQQITFAREDTA